jgi:hypothetical protein
MPLLLCMLWLTTAVAGASGEVTSSSEPENITLTFEKEVQISPDGYYLTGGFCRINHVPQTDLFALTFGAVIGDTQTTTGMEGGTNYYYKVRNTPWTSTTTATPIISTMAAGIRHQSWWMVTTISLPVGPMDGF